MMRMFSSVFAALALAALVGGSLVGVGKDGLREKDKADKDKSTLKDKAKEKGKINDNTHTGTFISAKGKTFTMESEGKEHSHTLAPTAKIVGGKRRPGTLEGLRKGTIIRVTTMEGDPSIAVRVEVLGNAKGGKSPPDVRP